MTHRHRDPGPGVAPGRSAPRGGTKAKARTLRDCFAAAWLATTVGCSATPAFAQKQQTFPTRPIRLVGLSAGGQVDTLARLLGPKLTEAWGQPVVIDNRPGAGATLAASTVAKAAPDGHTLLLSTVSFATSAALYADLPYDPIKDFTGITQIAFTPYALIVTPTQGVRTVPDLIALAKAQPGKIIFGSSGAGSGSHLAGERFRLAAEIKVLHVAFKGLPQLLVEVVTGRVHYCVCALASALPFIKDGKLSALAVNTPQRSPQLPDVPTLGDTLPGFEKSEGSIGLLAPARTSRAVVNRISREVTRILDLADIKERMLAQGFIAAPTTPEEYDKILRGQIETLSRVVREAGLRTR
jgi:tripartite-type tricarboxylate transporter receptor subunit TctC